jgi:membrane associated rhomboid family serine protease
MQYQLPPFSKTHKIYFSIIALFYVLGLFVAQVPLLGLNPASALDGHIYQIVTYVFFNQSLMGVIFEMLLLWFIGHEFEARWGSFKYLIFLFSTSILGGIIFAMATKVFGLTAYYSTLWGITGQANSLLIAYAVLYPNRPFHYMMLFPLKAKYFCLLILSIQILNGLGSPQAVQAWGHLGAMLWGFIWMKILDDKSMNWPKFGGGRRVNTAAKKSHLRLVPDKDTSKQQKYWQ